MTIPHLFQPLTLRSLTFKNRIFLSPMCQYSSEDGLPTDWHFIHLASRAVGGFSCIIQEATAITPEGRISPGDAGIWNDAQADAYKRSTSFIRSQGAIPAIQLAHAGRKASTPEPWNGRDALAKTQGGWEVIGPSAEAFDTNYLVPHALTLNEIAQLTTDFVAAAKRSRTAGFDVIELHAAHGYLLHEFLSPLSNTRTDQYGGSLENRMRLTLEIAAALRQAWPQELPVFVRISASDWVEGGWSITDSVALCQELKTIGIDFIDTSTGGNVPKAAIPNEPGYQVPFAAEIRKKVGMPTGAVGLITEPAHAEQILENGEADIVLLAREALRDPYWPLHAAHSLEYTLEWPKQYDRAKPHEGKK